MTVEDGVATPPVGQPSATNAAMHAAPDSALPHQASPADMAEAAEAEDAAQHPATSSAAQSVFVPLQTAEHLSFELCYLFRIVLVPVPSSALSNCATCFLVCPFDISCLILLLHAVVPPENPRGYIMHICSS